ncbi:hypothetical protein B0H19DRAFT_1075700 [Mycena capillaripes]|nr:hypothetical protein B0H19DRAFT_1075700 [Mycena capillaripes]
MELLGVKRGIVSTKTKIRIPTAHLGPDRSVTPSFLDHNTHLSRLFLLLLMALNTPDATDDADTKRITWNDPEVKAMLAELVARKDIHMSGNGFKAAVWTFVVDKVQAASPDSDPKKDKQKCMNKLSYLKKVFDFYIFVQKFSGSDWDDKKKHTTNTDEYIADFVKSYGNEYSHCFTTPCTYWTELDEIYSGLMHKATGENVQHLGTKKRRRTHKSNEVSTSTSSNPMTRAPLGPILTNASTSDNETLQASNPVAGPSRFDDELDVTSPPVSHKASKNHKHAHSDDDASKNEKSIKHQRSDSRGIACHNAEAGNRISCALKTISTVMAQPIVMSEDLSHINEIVEILKDTTLLPHDPRGKQYRTVSSALSCNTTLARVCILEQDRMCRIGILEGILEDVGLLSEP